MSEAVNLRTGERRRYCCPLVVALIAAYAQGTRCDHNTWSYQDRYAASVTLGRWHLFLGDWAVRLP